MILLCLPWIHRSFHNKTLILENVWITLFIQRKKNTSAHGGQDCREKCHGRWSCDIIKGGIKWLQTRDAGIEYSRASKENLANGRIWYCAGYLLTMPPPLPPSFIEDFDRRIQDVLRRRLKCIRRSSGVTAQISQTPPPENSSPAQPPPGSTTPITTTVCSA